MSSALDSSIAWGLALGQLLLTTKTVNHLLYWVDAVDVATISSKQQHAVDQVLDIIENKPFLDCHGLITCKTPI